ncbi:hypothetical protein C3L33_04390, partial [Rhododendron williamsianum]
MHLTDLHEQPPLRQLHGLAHPHRLPPLDYDPSNSSLSVAFIAPPAQPAGWISWAVNPTGTGMVGAQALVAFKKSNGSMTVQTYNITSYASIAQSDIAYEVSGASAEYSGGVMRMFATLALPGGTTSVNQVWQVGPSVTKGVPDKHAFQAANLNAKGVLDLVSGGNGGAPAPAPEASAPAPVAGGPGPSGGTGSSPSGLRGLEMVAWDFLCFYFLQVLWFVSRYIL